MIPISTRPVPFEMTARRVYWNRAWLSNLRGRCRRGITKRFSTADADYESGHLGGSGPGYDPPEGHSFAGMAKADLPVHVDCQPFADSYATVLGEVVPVTDRVNAGVVVGGDGVQGVALLNPMDDTDGLGTRDCSGSARFGALWGLCRGHGGSGLLCENRYRSARP